MTITPKENHSMGKSMKRKEDPRFLTGQGNYVDDLVIPGMLSMAIVHSPYPHARIKTIDKTAALALPGVTAVITGEDLVAAKLGWLPTFHGFDQQMVLAVGKVLFQHQEVAAVFADSREIAMDAAELVEVDYEPLDPVTTPFDSMKDETILRDDREKKTNHIFHWESGHQDETEAALAEA
ncbi:xanthine dehydrogenase family protein molybdopterin-binding subunit, partial [Deinococcus sp.]|uniref:xanthine dehydrogenase family protein molybdopterin-binding subunit n=1 Tax=Deinococcus sp. TaxID=47478 RepID=UPI0038D3E7E5